jgi:uncharacterized membrane protein YgcG
MAETKQYDHYRNNPNQQECYYGLSTYTKPSLVDTSIIPIGMEYRETDTMDTYTWTGTEWKLGSFGGGGSSSGGGSSVYWGSEQW